MADIADEAAEGSRYSPFLGPLPSRGQYLGVLWAREMLLVKKTPYETLSRVQKEGLPEKFAP